MVDGLSVVSGEKGLNPRSEGNPKPEIRKFGFRASLGFRISSPFRSQLSSPPLSTRLHPLPLPAGRGRRRDSGRFGRPDRLQEAGDGERPSTWRSAWFGEGSLSAAYRFLFLHWPEASCQRLLKAGGCPNRRPMDRRKSLGINNLTAFRTVQKVSLDAAFACLANLDSLFWVFPGALIPVNSTLAINTFG